jgi:hypothetical protein
MWGADFSLLRRLVWFAWASTNPDIAGMSEVAARRSILRGLVGKRKWSMAIAAGTYLVANAAGKENSGASPGPVVRGGSKDRWVYRWHGELACLN